MTTEHPYGPHRYVEVRSAAGKLRRVRVTSERSGVIRGWRVTLDGEKWEQTVREGGEEISRQELVIALTSDIRKEFRLNLHYCRLEEVKP